MSKGKRGSDAAQPLMELTETLGLGMEDISYSKFVEKIDKHVKTGLEDLDRSCGSWMPRPDCLTPGDDQDEYAADVPGGVTWISKLGRDKEFPVKGDYAYVHAANIIYEVNNKIYAIVSNYDGLITSYNEHGEVIAEYHGLENQLDDLEIDEDNLRIIATSENTCMVWNLDTGTRVTELSGHKNTIVNVDVSDDNKYLVTCSTDKTAKVWNNNTDTEIDLRHTLEGHATAVLNCAFSPDSKLLVTLSDDDDALVWDPAKGKCLGALQCGGATRYCCFSKDSSRVLVCTTTGGFLFDLKKKEGASLLPEKEEIARRLSSAELEKQEKIKNFKQVEELEDIGNCTFCTSVPMNSHGDTALVCDGEAGGLGAFLVSMKNGDTLLTFDTTRFDDYEDEQQQGVLRGTVSKDGSRAILIYYAGHATVYDTTNGAPMRRLVMNDDIQSALFTNGGVGVLMMNAYQAKHQWLFSSTRCAVFSESFEVVSQVLCLPGANHVVVRDEEKVQAIEAVTGKAIGEYTPSGDAQYVARFAEVSNGRIVVIAEGDGNCTLSLFNPLRLERALATVSLGDRYVSALKVSDSLSHFVVGCHSGAFFCFEVKGDSLKQVGKNDNDDMYEKITAVRFAKNGKSFALGYEYGSVGVYSLSCAQKKSWDEHDNEVSGLDFGKSNGKDVLVSASADRTVRVFEPHGPLNGKKPLAPGHNGRVADVCVVTTQHGNDYAVTAGTEDNIAIVWNLDTMERVHTLNHLGSVVKLKSMALTYAEGMVMTVTKNKLIRVWNINTGKQVSYSCCWSFASEVNDVSIDPTGSYACIGCDDGTAHLMSLSRVGNQPSCEEVMFLAAMDESPALEDAHRLGKEWPECVCDNHGDGWTVMHQLTAKGKADILKALSLTSYAHFCISLPAKKKLLQLAVDERQKTCVDVILSSMKEADAVNRIAGDVWPRLCAEYPSTVADFLSGVLEVSPPHVGKNVNKYPMKETDVMTGGSTVPMPWPQDEEAFESYWEEKAMKVNMNQATVPIKTYYVGVPKLAGFYEDVSKSPLHALVETGNAEAIGTPAMVAVLTHKWNKFARKRFLISLGMYLMYLLAFSWFSRRVHGNIDIHGADTFAQYPIFLAMYLAAASTIYLFFEIQELIAHPISYWKSPWNTCEITSYTCSLLFISFTVLGNANTARGIGAVAMVLLWIKMLAFARGFKGTGSFVKMLFTVLYDISFFMSILSIVVVGFAAAFYLLLYDVHPAVGFESIGMSLFTVYRWMLGDFDVDGFEQSEFILLSQILFCLFQFMTTIILLNLLIAILSDSYAAVQTNAMNEWRLEQAKIIVEIENSLPTRVRRRKKEWFPDWLQVMYPASQKVVGLDEGSLEDRVEKKVSEVVEAVNHKMAVLEDKLTVNFEKGIASVIEAVLSKNKSKLRREHKGKEKAAPTEDLSD